MVNRTGISRSDWHFGEENISSFQIHVNEIIRINVFQPLGNVQQQRSKFKFLQRTILEQHLQTSPVAELILNQHMIVLRPRRIVTNNIFVLSEHCMGVDLVQGRLLEGTSRYRFNTFLD